MFQLRISLMGPTPTIWRRLLVPGGIKLAKLHSIFQAAMGWEDYHLHSFEVGENRYWIPDPNDEMDGIDDASVTVAEVIPDRARFFYEYDFGDSWRHEVVVESIDPVALVLKFGVCLDGQRACPPEDCGGVGGYAMLLEAIADPDHEEHDDYMEWLGRYFNPEEFDLAATNAVLQRVH